MSEVKLLLGDCFTQMMLMPSNSVDAIITDPPYDMKLSLFEDYFTQMIRVCNGNIIVFCKPENQLIHATEYLFWVKTPSTKNYSRACGRFVEMILVQRSMGGQFNQLHWSQMTGVYDDRLINKPIHPFEKPISLMERLIRIYSNKVDTIFDPFMGSGTTGVACRNTGRNFLGIEIDPEYYKMANVRLLI